MKFTLNKADKQKLENLIYQRECNIYIADLILDLINSNQRYFKGIEESKMFDAFIDRLDCDPDVKDILDVYFKKGLVELDDKPYKENPYFKNIKIDNIKFDKYTLGYETYKPYEVFIADDYKFDKDNYYAEIPTMGYFKNTHKFIAIKENKVIWMSITPAETDTMVEHIAKMHGDIITYGLGLGYFQYMAALKDDVTSVTIVERDENIINLFKTHILPQFGKAKDKIIIWHEDAYNTLDKLEKYDCVYVDLWHNPNDGIKFYVEFKNIEKNYPNSEFYYWLEDGIISLMRRCIVCLLQEQFEDHLDMSCYQHADTYTDQVINKMYSLLRKKEFTTYKEINELISDESLKEMAKLLA